MLQAGLVESLPLTRSYHTASTIGNIVLVTGGQAIKYHKNVNSNFFVRIVPDQRLRLSW